MDDGQGVGSRCNRPWRRARHEAAYTTGFAATPAVGLLPQAPAAFTMSPDATLHATAPALSVRDLRKTYDNGVQALKGVSLDVAPGRFLRPARPQRRRQVHPDRHRQLAGEHRPAARCEVFGVDLARDRERSDAPDRPGAAGTELQPVREALRHPGATTPASTACRAQRRWCAPRKNSSARSCGTRRT